MNWDLNAENQKKYDKVTAEIRRLQTEMGVNPMTMEERAAVYQKKKEEQVRLTAEFNKIRPMPKWKV